MISRLDELLSFHQTALNLRTHRQQILASNIANADVPQFKARDIDFSRALQSALSQGGGRAGLAVTSPRHLRPAAGGTTNPDLLYRVPHQDSLDGNTVDMDVERAQFADNAIHVEANLVFLNGQIKGMLAAIQG
ncbi:MAG: flagellar basal body rod protein FlgB [Burkholderiales bacterium]|nr:flagellar basal body rod protein FlgB [Burkholderiales bacterium]